MKTKSTIKKITATFLAMVMTVIILPFSVSADASGTDWALDVDGKLTISSDAGMKDWYNKCGANRSNVKSIEIEIGVTSIIDYAFIQCGNLKSVTIPDSVTSIGFKAFELCTSLGSITIPSSVTLLSNFAFSLCYELETVIFDDDSQLKTILYAAFQSCEALKIIVIPSSVTSLGPSVFNYCTSLTSVAIPASLTDIDDHEVFTGCSSLLEFIVDDKNPSYSLGANGELMSKDKTKLIRYPSGKTSTVYSAPYGVKVIGKRAFDSASNLKVVIISDSVTTIDHSAFSKCESLTTVALNATSQLESIGERAFYYCTNLASITIPNSVTSIGAYAFGSCFRLETVDIPESVTSIGGGAFYLCTSLANITIPKSVTSIGAYAFGRCESLETVEFLGNTPPSTIGEGVFDGSTAIKKCIVPYGAADAYKSALAATISTPADIIVEGYVVNVNNGGGSGFFNVDDVVTVTAEPAPSGKVFDKWTTESTEVTFSDENSEKTTFTMPAGNVIVTATYKDKPVIPDPPSTGGSYTPPQPSVAGGTGWTAVNNAIAKAAEGTSISINLNGGTNLPKSVLDAVKGKDINLVITMSGGFVWTINGKDITDAKNIDLTVKKPLAQRIPTEVLNTVTGEKYQLYLGFSGDFGFKAVLTLPRGSSNSGRYANLFYFNPTTQKLEYISSGKIGSDGKADLDFSHASDYVITITSEIVTETIDTAESSAVDDNSQSNPTTGDRAIPFGAIIVIATGVILIKVKKQSETNL